MYRSSRWRTHYRPRLNVPSTLCSSRPMAIFQSMNRERSESSIDRSAGNRAKNLHARTPHTTSVGRYVCIMSGTYERDLARSRRLFEICPTDTSTLSRFIQGLRTPFPAHLSPTPSIQSMPRPQFDHCTLLETGPLTTIGRHSAFCPFAHTDPSHGPCPPSLSTPSSSTPCKIVPSNLSTNHTHIHHTPRQADPQIN